MVKYYNLPLTYRKVNGTFFKQKEIMLFLFVAMPFSYVI